MNIFPKLCLAVAVVLSTTAAQAITLGADADTSVEGSRFGNTIPGNGTDLGTSYDSFGNRSFKTYVRFDLGGYDGEKTGAVFSMTKSGTYPHNFAAVPYLVYAMNDDQGDDWIEKGENGISFNTAPANNSDDYFDMSGATFLGNWDVPIGPLEGTVESFDAPALTTFLNDGLGADGLATLIILNTQCCYEPFASREYAGMPPDPDGPRYPGPQLSFDLIDADPQMPAVPLPAALPLSLAALGSLGWIARRRKQG